LPTLAELRDVETIGVQLELPGGEVAVAEGEDPSANDLSADDTTADEVNDENDAEATAEASNEDPELSADADELDDDAAKPTLVAADEQDAERRFGEPPNDE
jgi:segregation and condensation protein B